MVKEIDEVLRVGKQFAKYVTTLSFDQLPKDVVHQAERLVLDTLGTIYLGSRKEEASGVSKLIRNLRENPECTVVGTNMKTSCSWAAFANASYSQVHDCNDGHRDAAAFGGSSHVGRVVIPTALALGEKLSLSGKEMITAMVIGYDAAVRIRSMEERIPTSTYGSATVAARMMKLDEDKLRFALGIAGVLSPSNFPQNMGYDTNFLSNGYSAKVGIEAAMMASEGSCGPPLGDDRRLSTRFAERGLGKEFEIMNMYIKPYPTCRMTHASVDAILDIKKETNLEPSDVNQVTIYQVTHGMYIAEKPVDVDSYYKTCEFNLPYITACAITDGEVGEKQFTRERIADPKLHELAKKVKVIPNEDLDATYPEGGRPTLIEVKTKDGKTYSKRITYPKGASENPLIDDELFKKFLDWAGPSITEKHAQEIKETIFKLDELDNVTELTKLLSG